MKDHFNGWALIFVSSINAVAMLLKSGQITKFWMKADFWIVVSPQTAAKNIDLMYWQKQPFMCPRIKPNLYASRRCQEMNQKWLYVCSGKIKIFCWALLDGHPVKILKLSYQDMNLKCKTYQTYHILSFKIRLRYAPRNISRNATSFWISRYNEK